MEIFASLILTLIAGLSTCIGYFSTYLKPKNINKFICISLSFAGSVMVLISVKELIPTPLRYIYNNYNFKTFIFVLIIIPIITYYLFKLISKLLNNNQSLYRVGVLTTITLILHNIPEGIITFMASLTNINLGIKLATGIIAHNVPEGILISIPIYYSTKKRLKAFLYTIIAALSEIFGALIFYLLFKKYITLGIINIITYLIGCLMIIISVKEILPEILKYKNYNWILYGVLLSLFILSI